MLFMEYVFEVVDRVIDRRGLVREVDDLDGAQVDAMDARPQVPMELPKAS